MIDPQNGIMRSRTRNVNHQRILYIEESQHITSTSSSVPSETKSSSFNHIYQGESLLRTEAKVMSGLSWGLRSRVEGFGVRKFAGNAAKSREGMLYVLRKLRERGVYGVQQLQFTNSSAS